MRDRRFWLGERDETIPLEASQRVGTMRARIDMPSQRMGLLL
jgi:hypothetical protein